MLYLLTFLEGQCNDCGDKKLEDARVLNTRHMHNIRRTCNCTESRETSISILKQLSPHHRQKSELSKK